jgi:hypothetical protein
MSQLLTIERLPHGVGGQNLSSKMPDRFWKQLRQKALQVYSNRCGICRSEAERLSLHEDWEFFLHPEVKFSVNEWHEYAAGRGWQLYSRRRKHYHVEGRQVRIWFNMKANDRLPALIKSGFTPYIDKGGNFRYAEDEGLRAYQVLVALVIVCSHCHSIKHLDKVRRLADEGRLDIEPVLQHYMQVNKVSREQALLEWDDFCSPREYECMIRPNEFIQWTQWVQTYEPDGKELSVYTPLDEWIAFVQANGIEAVSPHLFLQTL